jgi:hypothetical protein
MERGPGHRDIAAQRRLWKALERFHSRLPPLALFYVNYPEPLLHVARPGSIVLGDGGGTPAWEIYATSLIVGATRLAQS